MSDHGIIKRASSLPRHRRKMKRLTFKRSLSLSLPKSPMLTLSSRRFQSQEMDSMLPCALFKGKEQNGFNSDVSLKYGCLSGNPPSIATVSTEEKGCFSNAGCELCTAGCNTIDKRDSNHTENFSNWLLPSSPDLCMLESQTECRFNPQAEDQKCITELSTDPPPLPAEEPTTLPSIPVPPTPPPLPTQDSPSSSPLLTKESPTSPHMSSLVQISHPSMSPSKEPSPPIFPKVTLPDENSLGHEDKVSCSAHAKKETLDEEIYDEINVVCGDAKNACSSADIESSSSFDDCCGEFCDPYQVSCLDLEPILDDEEFICCLCYYPTSKNHDHSVYCDSCMGLFCKDCTQLHLRVKITEGFIVLKCPGDACTRIFTDDEVQSHCDDLMHIFIKNKVDAENNPRLKTCPGCNKVHHFEEPDAIPVHHKCATCGLRWCVPCHAPWHIGMTCKDFQKDVIGKGRKALKVWAKGKGKSYANAIKCPQCKFFIERISGCDHMCCSRCYTDFCYKCGKKHRKAGILGDHYSRYSFLGCKYNLSPNKPAVRMAVRSGVFVGMVVAVPIVAAFVVSIGCILVAVSPVAIPSVLIAKKCRK